MGIELVAMLLAALLGALATLIASWRHHIKMKTILRRPLKLAREMRNNVSKLVTIDDTAIATLTFFDVLYTAIKLNPNSLPYIASLDADSDIASTEDLVSVLQEASEAPDSSVQSWQDLDFLESQTDMAMYSPIEQAAVFADDPLGTSDSIIEAAGIGDSALGDGGVLDVQDFSSLFLHVPLISITVKSVRNWQKANEGRITPGEAVEETVFDGATLTAGAMGGLALGTKLGAILAPVTGGASLFIAPALFSALGILTGGALGRSWRENKYGGEYRSARAHYEAMLSASNSRFREFRQAFISSFGEIKARLQHRHRSNLQLLRIRGSEIESGPKRILFPSLASKAIQMSIAEMKREFRAHTLPVYGRLLDEVQTSAPERGGHLLFAQGKTYLAGMPQLEQLHDHAGSSLASVREAKARAEKEHAALQRKLGR